MTKEERTKQIKKSVDLMGWTATLERVKTAEDRTIFDELSEDFRQINRQKENKVLKKHGIAF